jgi:hypothetical protein
MEYYLAIKKNNTMPFTEKQMKLIIILNEIKASSKSQTLHIFTHMVSRSNMSIIK